MRNLLAFPGVSLRTRRAADGEGRLIDDAHECARRCLACAGTAWTGISEILDRVTPVPDQLLVILDCAELCEVTARSLMRGSSEIRRFCALTAEISTRASEAAANEPELEAFVEAARRCARTCRAMSEAE